MIIKQQKLVSRPTTVGEAVDALQTLDRDLPLTLDLDVVPGIYHIKAEPFTDEELDYKEWVELRDSY